MMALALSSRRHVTRLQSTGALLGGVLFGLAISLALLLAQGIAITAVFAEFVGFVFLSDAGLASVAVEATPLVLAGLAGAVALKVRFWNIGIEGQLWLGAIGATGVALYDAGPEGMRLALMAAAAMAAGAAWIAIPALLRIRLGVNEIIATLLLNYVAFLLVQHLVFASPAPVEPTATAEPEAIPAPTAVPIPATLPATGSIAHNAWWPALIGLVMLAVGAAIRKRGGEGR